MTRPSPALPLLPALLTPLAFASLLLLAMPCVQAQTESQPRPTASAPASPQWQALPPLQREILAPLEPEWNALDATQRGKWLELAARYPQMPPEEQARLQRRMSTWVRLSPAERQQARLGFQAARQLKADERQAKWEAYQALPEEKRQRLLDKASQKQKQKPLPAAAVAPQPIALPTRPPKTPPPRGLDLQRIDAKTLLPRAASAAQQQQ
jgi:hypothetical protein